MSGFNFEDFIECLFVLTRDSWLNECLFFIDYL